MSSEATTRYADTPNQDLLAHIPPDACVVLDVGCGSGALGAAYRHLNPRARVLGIERDPDAAAIAGQRLDSVACVDVELQPLPFDGLGGYDCIVYGDVLQQLRGPWAVLRRHLEVLSPGGTVLICVANAEHWSMAARLLRGGWGYEAAGLFDVRHLRWFSLRSVIRELTDAGLMVEEVHPRIFAQEQARKFVGTLRAGLQELGIDADEYARRAMALQYVVRARRAGLERPIAVVHRAEFQRATGDRAETAPLEGQVVADKQVMADQVIADNESVGRNSDERLPSDRLPADHKAGGSDAASSPGACLTITDLSPLIDPANVEKRSAAGIEAVDLFANGGRYLRRTARLLGSDSDITAHHQRHYAPHIEEYPPVHRVVFKDATITGQGTVILKDFRLINDSCWEVFAQGGVPHGLQRLSNGDLVRSLQPSRRIDAPCLLLKRPFWRNYGHWLVDSAALLALIDALAMPEGWQIVIGAAGDTRMREIMFETLDMLAPGIELIEHPDSEAWEFAELHYVMPVSRTPVFKLPLGLAALRTMVLRSCRPRMHRRKIYIDRGPEWGRKIENEEELRNICRADGFEFVKPEHLSLRAQGELFNSATVVVGMKGAALTNLLFCTSSASAVVLAPDSWVEPFFWDIAGQFGLKYVEVLGPTRDATARPGTASFRIDPDLFADALAEASGAQGTGATPAATPVRKPIEAAATHPLPGSQSQPVIVSADTRFTSRSLTSLTTTVGMQGLRDTPVSRVVLAPAGSIEMPPCFITNPPLSWQCGVKGVGSHDPLPISDSPYNHLFPRDMPYPEMWLARIDNAYHLAYGAPFLPGPRILINDFLVPWGPSGIGWFRYEGGNTYRLPIDLSEVSTVDTAFFMGHPISGHFGHFVGDCLSRMHAWQKCRELFGDVKIILEHSKHDTQFRDKLLAALGVRQEDVVLVQGGVHCRTLLLGSNAFGVSQYACPTSATLWQQIRDSLAGPGAGAGERIYLSRSGQSGRKLLNEAQVEALFGSLGFVIVQPERLPIEEQISIVSNARLIAGPAGSAMFNLAFQRRLASVMILIPETFIEITEWLFLAATNCPLYYHIGLRDTPLGSRASVADAWRVDLSRLASDVANWLSRA